MKFRMNFWVFAVISAFAVNAPAFADENEVTALKSEVKDLNGKIESLERIVRGIQSSGGNAPAASTYVPKGEGDGGIIKTPQDINMGGYVDVQYNMNFDKPYVSATSQPASRLRVFDGNADSFAVNAAELYFEKAAEEPGDAGFRIDVQWGQDARVVNADGTVNHTATTTALDINGSPGTVTIAGAGDSVDLQQAYVEYIAPIKFFEGSEIFPDDVHFKVGRFTTLAGMEVIESIDNYNITRSVAFGFAVPFTHTGIRSNFQMFNDFLDIYLGLNNGWDLAIDNNTYKTLELGVGWSPLENLNFFHTFYTGSEKSARASGRRWLITNTASYSVTDALTVAGEINVGHERDVANTTPVFLTQNATWHSYAGYVNYEFTDRFSTAARYELFRDDDLFRSGVTDSIFGQTYTASYKLTDNLTARGEFRHDKSNDDPIFGDDSARTSLHAQLVYVI